jgi:hypothetical protein
VTDLRSLTPADRRQVLTALEPIVDRELASVAAAADAVWRGRGVPPDVRELLCDLLLADVRRECWALVRERLTPRGVH